MVLVKLLIGIVLLNLGCSIQILLTDNVYTLKQITTSTPKIYEVKDLITKIYFTEFEVVSCNHIYQDSNSTDIFEVVLPHFTFGMFFNS